MRGMGGVQWVKWRASAQILDRQVTEEDVEWGEASSTTGADLVGGDHRGVGIQSARVVDPVADALESELLAGGGDADLVAGQMHAEERVRGRGR